LFVFSSNSVELFHDESKKESDHQQSYWKRVTVGQAATAIQVVTSHPVG
jgi:hypothetical protein